MADLSEILRPWFQEYNEEIRSLAKEAAAIKDEEERETWLHETIDGHEWVIYTFKARCVLIATDNPDAYGEDFGEEPKGPEQAAYAAMMHDVREAIPAFDADEDEESSEPSFGFRASP